MVVGAGEPKRPLPVVAVFVTPPKSGLLAENTNVTMKNLLPSLNKYKVPRYLKNSRSENNSNQKTHPRLQKVRLTVVRWHRFLQTLLPLKMG